MRQKSGFTLIELLVVIAIIALLATLAVISFTNAQKSARDGKRVADMKQLQTALETLFTQTGKYSISCPKGAAVKVCDDAGLTRIIPGIKEIDDPSFEPNGESQQNLNGICDRLPVNPEETNCEYGWGDMLETEYYVYFSTENQNVQGLTPNALAHSLSIFGID